MRAAGAGVHARKRTDAGFLRQGAWRWIAETWPTAGLSELALSLGDGILALLLFASDHWPRIRRGDAAVRQRPRPGTARRPREDDGKSLTFDRAPLEEGIETLGAPVLDLEFSVDRPTAFLAIRICEVKPDGTSVRVNLGLHNLTRRNSEREPVALVPLLVSSTRPKRPTYAAGPAEMQARWQAALQSYSPDQRSRPDELRLRRGADDDGFACAMSAQPVIPILISDDWNLI